MKRVSRRARAFSLIEVMLSSTLLIIGITAVVVGVTVALALHEHERKVARALVIAEKRMEDLLLLFRNSTELSPGLHPPTGFEGFSENGRPGGTQFRVVYTATPAPAGSIGQTIEVTVSWDERLGERSLSLATARDN